MFLPSLALFTLMAIVLYPYKNKMIKFTSQRPMSTLTSLWSCLQLLRSIPMIMCSTPMIRSLQSAPGSSFFISSLGQGGLVTLQKLAFPSELAQSRWTLSCKSTTWTFWMRVSLRRTSGLCSLASSMHH